MGRLIPQKIEHYPGQDHFMALPSITSPATELNSSYSSLLKLLREALCMILRACVGSNYRTRQSLSSTILARTV